MNAYLVIGAILTVAAVAVGLKGAKNLLEWRSGVWCAAAWGTLIPALALMGYGIYRTTV